MDKCGEDYQSVNIYITFRVSVIHLNVLARLPLDGATQILSSTVRWRRIFPSLSDLFEVLEECAVCSVEFTHLQDSLQRFHCVPFGKQHFEKKEVSRCLR